MENKEQDYVEAEVVLTEEEIEKESLSICHWAAARAGVIVVAPLVGSMALMANEVYMISKLAKLRGVSLSEGAIIGLLGAFGGTFVGQTLCTLIPFAPIQLPVGISVTYGIGRVVMEWLKAGQPEDFSAFKKVFEDSRKEAIEQLKKFKEDVRKDTPLGDESKRFDTSSVEDTVADLKKKAADFGKEIKEKLKDI